MSNENKLFEKEEDVKEFFENNITLKKLEDMKIQKLKEELLKSFERYRKTLNYLAADAPIEIMGLPTATQNCLLAHGLFRIYDLLDCDFTKVKGLGEIRIRDITSRLDQFCSMF